jgi:hypothetical protein
MPTTTTTGPTLTSVTAIGRKGVLFLGIGLVTLIVGRTFFNASVAFYRAMNPPPPPPPTVGFGVLPALRFPEKEQADKPTTYRLETATGSLPTFGDRAKVFLVTQSSPSLLGDDRVKQLASKLGYVFEPETLDSRTYRWTKAQPLQSTLEADAQTLVYSITTDYLARPDILLEKKLPDTFEAVSRVKGVVSTTGQLPRDIATASGQTKYLKALGGEVQEALSFSDADFIQVDINRMPIDGKFPMYTPAGKKGIIHAIVSGFEEGQNSLVHLENYYHPVEYSQVHTYPLRTPQQAWQLLQAGEGYVAQKGSSDQAVIRDVFLGYYDDTEEQSYLQPVYVFEGDNGFLGFVPAINPQWIQGSAAAGTPGR